MLQNCLLMRELHTHSMGTIQARNALLKAPKEIRDRVIVVAIGPACVIDEGLCHDAAHYASKNDPIHLGENVHTLITFDLSGEPIKKELLEQLMKNKQRIIIVEPHPDEKGMGHDFGNPAFIKYLNDHIKTYLKNGVN